MHLLALIKGWLSRYALAIGGAALLGVGAYIGLLHLRVANANGGRADAEQAQAQAEAEREGWRLAAEAAFRELERRGELLRRVSALQEALVAVNQEIRAVNDQTKRAAAQSLEEIRNAREAFMDQPWVDCHIPDERHQRVLDYVSAANRNGP